MGMRQAGCESAMLKGEDGSLLGVNLKGNHCAEHEWGIEGIESSFSINRSILGVEGRLVKKLPPPELLRFETKGQKAILYFVQNTYTHFKSTEDETTKHVKKSVSASKDSPFSGAWDSRSFAIEVYGKENMKLLKELYEAIQRLDVTISLGSSANPFDKPGLWLMVYSKISSEMKEATLSSDLVYKAKIESELARKATMK